MQIVERVTFVEVLEKTTKHKKRSFKKKAGNSRKKHRWKKNMKIPYEVTFLVYIIQKFCSSSPHTAKFKKNKKTFHLSLKIPQAPVNILVFLVKEYTNFTTNLTHQFHPENAPGNHWSPRPQIESTLWRSDCTSPGKSQFGKRMGSQMLGFYANRSIYIL